MIRNFLLALLLLAVVFLYWSDGLLDAAYYKMSAICHKEKCVSKPVPDFITIEIENGSSMDIPRVVKALSCKTNVNEEADSEVCQESFVMFDEINMKALDALKKAHSLYPEVNTVCFRSFGGSTTAGLQIAQYIETNTFNTCMSGTVKLSPEYDSRVSKVASGENNFCHSTCPFVLLAGEKRYAIGDQFKIKVHRPGVKYCVGNEDHKVDVFKLRFFNDFQTMAAMVSPEDTKPVQRFYDKAISHPYSEEDLLPVLFEELITNRVFTEVKR
tara:strand:- start:2497 stop:3309 length:813 start_codon:yes stop_codon:yes gene_type:complete